MTYLISDIHGEYWQFLKLLEKIGFSSADKLFICGDIVDKGKNSIKLAKYISQMPNAKCILGNHEYEFLKYYWALMRQSPKNFDGVLKDLQSYFKEDGYLLDWELVDWFEGLPYFLEEESFICVHAGVPLDGKNKILPLDKATPEQLVYDRNFKSPELEVKGGKCVFFGHTPTGYLQNGESKIIAYKRQGAAGNSIADFYKVHLDTGTWLYGVLGCFCVETLKSIYIKN